MKQIISLLAVMFVVSLQAHAEPDFSVSNAGAGAYIINGESNPTLSLVRGQTYTFDINASGHPFLIKTEATIGTGAQYTEGVDGNGTALGTLSFTVPASAPDTLFYICQFHGSMQGTIEITDAPQSIVDIAAGNPVFSTLVTALQATGLDTVLDGEGSFTVFAPTNEAFDDLPEGLLAALLEDTDALTQVLLYHVVAGAVLSGDLAAGPVETLQGFPVEVDLEGGVFINDAEVTTADVEASNGVIHIIDEVLIPPTLVEIAVGIEDEFTILEQALVAAGLVDALQDLGPFTVFAPTDDAFLDLPEGVLDALLDDPEALAQVLLYHVAAGRVFSTDLADGDVTTLQGFPVSILLDEGVFVNTAEVIDADIEGLNGVIHVIDEVLIPPTLVEIAVGIEDEFTMLEQALIAADLVDALQDLGPFTVFAPTDAAFDALPAALVSELLEQPDVLAEILLYHVVPGRVRAADLESGSLASLQGAELDIEVSDPTINEVSIEEVDIEGLNGVIHVIDSVLFPADGFRSEPDAIRARVADGLLSFVWFGVDSESGTLEYTDDLITDSWQPVTTLGDQIEETHEIGVVNFVGLSADSPVLFFRLNFD